MNPMPIEPFALVDTGLFAVWLLGISVGFTACTASCLPYMGSWVMSRHTGLRGSLIDTGLFSCGKVLAYATLGAISGVMGTLLLQYLKLGIGNVLIGSASVLAGIALLRQPTLQHRRCGLSRRQNLHPLLLGFSLSFIPCAPLAALLAACAAAGSVGQGMAYGFVFGLGAALTPLFIILPLLGGLGRELRTRHQWLERWLVWLGAGVLIIIGAYRITLVI